jgi:hypothetical protein
LQVNAGATVGLSGLTIANGSASNGSPGNYSPYRGGAIFNRGTLTLSDSTLSGNHAADVGGGIINYIGTVVLTNSTVTGNSARGTGGIQNWEGTLEVTDSTIFGNTATVRLRDYGKNAGGISNYVGTVAVTDSTISGNAALFGGGIDNYLGRLTLTNSTLSGNSAADVGGGIRNVGSTAVVANCTLSGNRALSEDGDPFGLDGGGGIWNLTSGGNADGLTVTNSTLYGNSAKTGGGIRNAAGSVAVTNSTLSGNSADVGGGISNLPVAPNLPNTLTLTNSIVANSPSGGDISGSLSGGHNLFGSVALGPLADNGGPTRTMALPAGSPAIDAGDNALAVDTNDQPLTSDQRGVPFARIQSGAVDMGAFEVQDTATAVRASPGPSTYGQAVTFTATVTSGPFLVTGGTVTFTEGGTVLASAVPLDADGQASFTTAALPAGGHTITASFSGATGLRTSSGSVDQAVNPATLLVTANDASRSYGTANPTFTYSITGLVNGDTVSVVSGSPALTTTATVSSAPGRYTITASQGTLSAANYTFSLVNATLTVSPAPLSATGVNISATAGAPFSGIVATFTNTDPFGNAASYTALINWGDGSTSAGVISGTGTLTVTGSHTYADPINEPVQVKISHNLGYTTTATTKATATVTSLGLGVSTGQTAGIGFWQNNNGQALIASFNGGSTSTMLSAWLASTFPNLYGARAGGNNLTGKSNAQVAAFYLTLFAQSGPKVDAEVLAAALNVYATTQSLGGNAGVAYGFAVTANGLGASSVNVGADGAAFGVANNTTRNVYQLLLAVNRRAVNGVLYNGDATLRQQASDLFDALNSAGGL